MSPGKDKSNYIVPQEKQMDTVVVRLQPKTQLTAKKSDAEKKIKLKSSLKYFIQVRRSSVG